MSTQATLRATARTHMPSPSVTWGVALVLYVGGDMATTAVGLQLGAVENNPIAVLGITHVGLWPAMTATKAAVVGWTVACWRTSPDRVSMDAAVYPGILAVAGAGITAWNGWIIWQVL